MSSAPSERRDVVLNVRGGGRLCVPEELGQVTPYVLLEQEDWFEHEIRFVRRWLQPGMRAVDVGANYGVYTLAAARAVGRDGRVWAFEPTPASAGYLERSLALNEGLPAKLMRLAVSDHAGEVPFLLKGSPEENAVASDPGAPGVIGVPAVPLDELAGEWGEVDFLKLDVEGHELQAVGGGEGFLAARSPLVMLEIRSGREFDLGAPGRLQALGYAMYRLLPGPQILVPFDADEPFDSSLLNIFACKPDRAEKVSAAGFLARDPGAAFKAHAQGWIDYAAATPYARTLGARWRAKAGFLASPADKAYFEGLAAFALSRDPAQGADARAAALLHAFACVERALEADVGLSKQLSYARLAWEIGRSDLALDTLTLAVLRLEGEWRQALEEPFLAPCARYDPVPATERPEDWLRCAIIEQVEKLRAFSSLFVRQTVHEILRPIIGLPFRSPEMDRRWQLARMAAGSARERVEALCAPSDENLNPQYWCPGVSTAPDALAGRRLPDRPAAVPATLSIGMAAHGNAGITRTALDMLFAAASGDFELILVDDRSPDATLEVFLEARKRHANTRVFSFQENLEYCHSVNAFLSHARGERLLFLSNDIFVSPAYLRALLKAAASIPRWGVLRGSSNFVDLESALHNVPFEGECTRDTLFGFAADVAARTSAEPVDERYLVGDAFLVSRELLGRIGTFDTRFTGYCGDADFSLRAQIAGFRVALVQQAFAYHAQHANILYLPPEAQQKKLALRFARASEALRVLLEKYRVPAQGIGIDQIPWEDLRKAPFDPAAHYVAPLDYSRYLVA